MMWQFTKLKKSASGIIVPLSIAYHSGKPYKNLRNKIQSINGEWTFQFFDRTPDSIFGDDIKTRNSIIFFKRNNSSENSITSSTFKRWNSRNRVALFNNLKSIKLKSIKIKNLIPKIGTSIEFDVYKNLQFQRNNLKRIAHKIRLRDLNKYNKVRPYPTISRS